MLTVRERFVAIGSGRTGDAIRSKIYFMRMELGPTPREIARASLKIGYLDIEASDLKANIGIMLTAAIKPAGDDKVWTTCITKADIMGGDHDKRILTELLKEFEKYDVLYTYYGADGRFDYPFIRTRALRHGLEILLPQKGDIYLMDLWPTARMKLKLHSNRMDAVAEVCGVGIPKTPLSPRTWEMARSGDSKALQYILQHNINDVLILEAIHEKVKEIERPIYRTA